MSGRCNTRGGWQNSRTDTPTSRRAFCRTATVTFGSQTMLPSMDARKLRQREGCEWQRRKRRWLWCYTHTFEAILCLSENGAWPAGGAAGGLCQRSSVPDPSSPNSARSPVPPADMRGAAAEKGWRGRSRGGGGGAARRVALARPRCLYPAEKRAWTAATALRMHTGAARGEKGRRAHLGGRGSADG